MVIFVIPIASYFNFVALDQLRKLKYEKTKKIREWMKEEVPGFNFGLS